MIINKRSDYLGIPLFVHCNQLVTCYIQCTGTITWDRFITFDNPDSL